MVRSLLAPRLLGVHVLGLAATVAAVLLALWQYGAWQAGRELEVRNLTDQPPRALGTVLTADGTFPNDQVGRPVRLSGAWLPESTIQVTGRELDGRTGRWVVTPVAVCGQAATGCPRDPAILVVRGWSAPGQEVPAAPTGPVELTGWLQPGEGAGLPDPDPRDAVLPELRIASALQKVDQDLYGGYVIGRDLRPAATGGLAPVTPESLPEPSTTTSLRNLLYALEWLAFGGFAIYIWVRWVRDDLAEAAPDDAGQPSPEEAGIPSSS